MVHDLSELIPHLLIYQTLCKLHSKYLKPIWVNPQSPPLRSKAAKWIVAPYTLRLMVPDIDEDILQFRADLVLDGLYDFLVIGGDV